VCDHDASVIACIGKISAAVPTKNASSKVESCEGCILISLQSMCSSFLASSMIVFLVIPGRIWVICGVYSVLSLMKKIFSQGHSAMYQFVSHSSASSYVVHWISLMASRLLT